MERPKSTVEQELGWRSSKRLFEFDALRGIAAFCVIWHHLRSALPGDPLHHKVLYPLFAGHQAVMLFFVLSGYVLSMPYLGGTALPYGRYLARRVLRIYIPYVAALGLAWICASHYLFSALPLTPWFYLTWHTPLNGSLLVQELLMSTSPALNTAFWSLHYEMEMSIVFPCLVYVLQQVTRAGAIMLVVVCSIVGNIWIKDFSYMAVFLVGIILCREREAITAAFQRMSKIKRLVLLLVCVGLYYLQVPEHLAWSRVADDSSATLGAAGIVIFSINEQSFQKVLRFRVFEYLGKISYSLYLVHGTVLFFLLNALFGRISLATLVVVFGVSSVTVAHLFYFLVEAPGMRFGKRITS